MSSSPIRRTGRAWRQGRLKGEHQADDSHSGIQGDLDTGVRDAALALWAGRRALVFGDLMLSPPAGNKQVLIYKSPPTPEPAARPVAAGGTSRRSTCSARGPAASAGSASIVPTGARSQGNPSSAQSRYGHPHAKPVDVMEQLVMMTAEVVADPFAGSGSTLVACRNLGRPVIGVELEEQYCERIAERLNQGALPFGEAS